LKFIKCGLIPFIKKYHSDGNYKFLPDQLGAHYSGIVVNHLVKEKINFIEKIENPANIPEVRAIEDFWSILKEKVYENNWNAENLAQLRNKKRLRLRKMDPNLVYKLITSTSSRLNKMRIHGLIEKIILEQIKTRRNFLIKNYFTYYQM
jgi:hypothetical protein